MLFTICLDGNATREQLKSWVISGDRPLLRTSNAAFASDRTGLDEQLEAGGVGGPRLHDVHKGIKPSGISGGSTHLVQGSYDYHHYMQVWPFCLPAICFLSRLPCLPSHCSGTHASKLPTSPAECVPPVAWRPPIVKQWSCSKLVLMTAASVLNTTTNPQSGRVSAARREARWVPRSS